MRILFHHRTRAEDAQGVHIGAMVKAFRDLGHEVDIVALAGAGGDTPEEGRGRGGWDRLARRVPRVGLELMQLGYNLYGYRQIARRLRSRRYDLIYERYSLNTFCGIWAGRRFGVPVLLEVNAPLYREERALGQLRLPFLARRSERWICSHSTRTLVVSDVMRSMLEEDGVPAGRLLVVRNGVDPREFHPGVSGAEVRRRYGLDGRCVIGVVGWFRPWHGVETLLEAAHRAGLGARAAHVLLVGDGPAVPELRRLAAALSIEDHVTFTGAVKSSEVPAHVAALDIAVQPHATAYASPMKLFEYMAMERCIVAPDQPNIREILQDGVNGFLFRPRDREALTAALSELVQDPARRRAAGEAAGRTVVEREYFWQANARRVLALVSPDGSG